MGKVDVIEKIRKTANVSREEAEEIFFIFLNSIILSLKKREKVKISGFGTFYVKELKSKGKRKKIEIVFKPMGSFRKL